MLTDDKFFTVLNMSEDEIKSLSLEAKYKIQLLYCVLVCFLITPNLVRETAAATFVKKALVETGKAEYGKIDKKLVEKCVNAFLQEAEDLADCLKEVDDDQS